MCKKEIWADVPGYGNKYKISSYGKIVSKERTVICRIRNKKYVRNIKEKTLKQFNNSAGYMQTNIVEESGIEKKVYIHRLVAISFLPNPNNLTDVNHKNGDKSNNSVENLEWVSHRENIVHSIDKLGHKPTGRHSRRILEITTNTIFSSVKEAAKTYSVAASYIYSQINGRVDNIKGRRFEYID